MKKPWIRNLIVFGFIWILVFSTVDASAMMGGGRSSGGHMTGGGSSDGNMGGGSSSGNMMGGGNSGGSMMDSGNSGGSMMDSGNSGGSMMDGGNSGGSMMDGGNSGGSMMDGGNYSKDRMPDMQRNGYNPEAGMLRKEKARDLVNRHMNSRYWQSYRIGPITDKKSYYQTEVTRPDGKLLKRFLIDKKTGRIHSLR